MSPPSSSRPAWQKILSAVIAAVVALGAVITITNVPGPDHQTHTITIHLGGQGERSVTLTPPAQAIVRAQRDQRPRADDTSPESGLRGPDPSAAALAQGNRVAPPQPTIPAGVPQASPSAPGCVDAFVRNQSSRNGAKVELGVIHWTGSRSLPHTTADDLAIARWFDTSAAQASSNYVADDDGHCYYLVPETAKAWTQAAANPWAVSVEYVNPGVLPLFHGPAGRAVVVRLIRGWHHRWGIPYQVGAVNSSCVPTRPGFLAHRDLGPCGGGHPDVGVPSIVPSLIREAAAGDVHVTARDRRDCRKVRRYVLARRHGRHPGRRWARAVRRREARVRSHGFRCSRGHVRRT